MIGLVVKLVLGVVLFAGTLVGGLAATGRLNHEGTANIPLLSSFFPAPPESAEGEDHGADGDGGHATQDPASSGKDHEAPRGAAHDAKASPAGETAAADASHTQQGEGDAPRKQKTGRSLVEPEAKAGGGHGDSGGHGDAPKDPSAAPDANDGGHGAKDKPAAAPAPKSGHADKATKPEGDFEVLEQSLANAKSRYKPGELFTFQGLPAGITPDQVNEAWQRVQGLMAEIDRRKLVLDQQEELLREQSEDISRRQAALGKERVEIEQMHRQLDQKIAAFQEQVKLVRSDEVPALKRNAQTLASFEPEKAAQLLEAQWKTDKGQDEVVKLLEFMEKDAVNAILAVLPPALTQDVMKKRLRVSKEPAPSGKGS